MKTMKGPALLWLKKRRAAAAPDPAPDPAA